MEFKLSTAGNFYLEDKGKKLEGLGFKFEIMECSGDYMKEDFHPTVEINTLEELMNFI